MTRTLFDPPAGPDVDDAGPTGRQNERGNGSNAPVHGNRPPADPRGLDHQEAESPAAVADEDAGAAELGKLGAMAQLAGRYPGRVLAAQRTMIGLLLELPDAAVVTIDNVRSRLGEVDANPRWLGCVVHGLSAAGLIARSDYTASRRRVAHARPVSAWRLKDRAAARTWLDRNGAAGSGAGA